MQRTAIEFRQDLHQLIDAGVAWFSLTLAVAIRREMTTLWPHTFPAFDFWPEGGWLYVVLIFLWVALFNVFGLYVFHSESLFVVVKKLLRANGVGIILAFFIFYFLTIKNVPRVLILLFATCDVIFMCAKECFMRRLEPHWRSSGRFLLIGKPEEFTTFLERFKGSMSPAGHIEGYLLPPENGHPNPAQEEGLSDVPCLGSTENLLKHLHETSATCVVLSPQREHFGVIQDIIRLCEIEGVEVWLLGSFFKTSVARARVDEFQDLPMLTFSTTPSASWALFTKRLLDLAGSFVLLALTSPIILAAALAIKWTSPGTIIFRQERCTLYGRTFTMYKFRTMVDEAEQLRTELEARNEQAGPVFKIREDPRITPVGRFIRRYSIDELPQLINVLKGDMSLVGPRPPIPSEVAKYESWQRRRLSMRSGITCIWQTMGRNEVTFEDWMKLDLEYIDRWSLLLDAQILLRTPAVVLRGTGF